MDVDHHRRDQFRHSTTPRCRRHGVATTTSYAAPTAVVPKKDNHHLWSIGHPTADQVSHVVGHHHGLDKGFNVPGNNIDNLEAGTMIVVRLRTMTTEQHHRTVIVQIAAVQTLMSVDYVLQPIWSAIAALVKAICRFLQICTYMPAVNSNQLQR